MVREARRPARPDVDAKVGSAWQVHEAGDRHSPKDERERGLQGDQPVEADVADRKDWAWDRPATVVATRPLVPDPGANANRFNDSTKSRNDGIRIGLGDALVLQSFPRDYPVRGNKSQQFRQVGDACCPRMMVYILAAVTGRPLPDGY